MTVRLLHGDCRRAMRLMAARGVMVDAIVTDPPYHLTSIVKRFGANGAAPAKDRDGLYKRASAGFMGKQWDGGDIAFDPETWVLAWRVLKPGGHLLAFGASRGSYRLACAIEDAGFEIRDSILEMIAADDPVLRFMASLNEAQRDAFLRCIEDSQFGGFLAWVFGSGFPKSHQVSRNPMFCQCGEAGHSDENKGREHMRGDRIGRADASERDGPRLTDDLYWKNTEQDFPGGCQPGRDLNDAQPRPAEVGGQVSSPSRLYVQEHTRSSECGDGQVHGSSDIPSPVQCTSRRASTDFPPRAEVSGAPSNNVPNHTSHDYTSGTDGHRPDNSVDSSCVNYGNGFPCCQTCGKPKADGFGTALKPAFEPIILARKPLSESSVAANVLRHGTGGLNIDGCRIGFRSDADRDEATGKNQHGDFGTGPRNNRIYGTDKRPVENYDPSKGRWPANLVHDGSDEVEAAFAAFGDAPGQQRQSRDDQRTQGSVYGKISRNGVKVHQPRGDSGTASRFFFSGKAGPDDRFGSKHPTVKPVALMRWLVRLVTPPGGTVLDPFAGSGTTGVACIAEGFHAVLCEREAEYVADIRARLDHYEGKGKHSAAVKHRNRDVDPGPLFQTPEAAE